MDNENRAMMSSSSSLNSTAFSFISKGSREVRDGLGYPTHAPPSQLVQELTLAEIDFVKRLQPKLSEFRRAYSSPDFSKKVLEKWTPRSRLQIDLSAIRNAIVAEVEDGDGVLVDFDRVRKRNVVSFREFWREWKSEVEGDEAAQRRK